jgi:long-chain acyl-CoA synthetase
MPNWTLDCIAVEAAVTLDGLFAERVQRTPDAPAYAFYDRHAQDWFSYSWQEAAQQVARWQEVIARWQLPPGERVGMLLRNCPEWIFFEQAATSLGLVTVPLYTDDRPDSIAHIVRDSGMRLLLVQDDGRWLRLAPALAHAPHPLTAVLLLDTDEQAQALAAADPLVHLVADLLPQTACHYHSAPRVDPQALATIVYTSGTTGLPKGVMLSHQAILSVAHAGLSVIPCYCEDRFLSFLPLSHTMERTVGYYAPMMAGASVTFARSVAQLGEDLLRHAPTVLVAVPRVFERVHAKINAQLQRGSFIKRWLFAKATKLGWQAFEVAQGRSEKTLALRFQPLLDRLVGAKIRAKLGGQLRFAVAGGAPLPEFIARTFIGLGVPVLQGYGLTETAPIISGNLLHNNVPASVGLPLPGIEVRVGAQDELLVKTPGMMLGYWNNHSATYAMIDSDGWLHTGDQARLDAGGRIFITGRLKDILVLSNGEKVPPADMESVIAADPMFEQVMVLGEGQAYLAAIAVVDANFWTSFSGGKPFTRDSINDAQIQREAIKRMQQALHAFPAYARIRRVLLLETAWSIEDDLLTPTLKVKRQQVRERFAAEIASLYD